MTTPDLDRLARTAYEAHRGASAAPLPPWEDTTAQEQQAWRAAMSAVAGPGDVTVAEGVPTHALVLQTADQTRVFHSEFTAGRQGTLAISDETASSHHALFQFARGLWYVQDLDSTNGTFLNGRRIFMAQRLKKGDKIKIGRTVLIVVSVLSRGRRRLAGERYRRMLTARATIRATVTTETAACTVMAIFAQRDSGMTSVGLKAVALVNDRYR